jgi:hypothetical protein
MERDRKAARITLWIYGINSDILPTAKAGASTVNTVAKANPRLTSAPVVR